MTDLADLKRRVEEATGPDRDLDARLWKFFNPTHRVLFDAGSVGGRSESKRPSEWGVLRDFDLDGWPPHGMAAVAAHVGAPLLTSSLDATVALIERVMPGFARQVAYIPNIPTRKTDAEAKLWLPAQQTRGWKKEAFSGEGKTEALALLAALLSACEQGGAK